MTHRNVFFILIVTVLLCPTVYLACEYNSVRVGLNEEKLLPIVAGRDQVEIVTTGLRSSLATGLVIEYCDNNATIAMTHYDLAHKDENLARMKRLMQSVQQSSDMPIKKATMVVAAPAKLYQNWFLSWFNSEKKLISLYPQWENDIINTVKQSIEIPLELTVVPYKVGGDCGAIFSIRDRQDPGFKGNIYWSVSMDTSPRAD